MSSWAAQHGSTSPPHLPVPPQHPATPHLTQHNFNPHSAPSPAIPNSLGRILRPTHSSSTCVQPLNLGPRRFHQTRPPPLGRAGLGWCGGLGGGGWGCGTREWAETACCAGSWDADGPALRSQATMEATQPCPNTPHLRSQRETLKPLPEPRGPGRRTLAPLPPAKAGSARPCWLSLGGR